MKPYLMKILFRALILAAVSMQTYLPHLTRVMNDLFGHGFFRNGSGMQGNVWQWGMPLSVAHR